VDERSGELLLTYTDLGERLGISADGARMRAKREGWRLERNDPSGPMRVRVSSSALPEQPPERRTKSADGSGDFEERLAELAANVAEIRVMFERTSGVEAKLRAELTEARIRASVAEARLEAEREAAKGQAAARDATIGELRAMLADARRPWWRRLVG
jgi:hypothetical protein